MKIELPMGNTRPPVDLPHFPARWQAFLWRNWELVTPERIALVLRTTPETVMAEAAALGLPVPPVITEDWISKGYLTLIRRNWHLLPYSQMLELLGWTAEQMAISLKEDDFMWHKMGMWKPDCAELVYGPLTAEQIARTAAIRKVMRDRFDDFSLTETPFKFAQKYRVPEQIDRIVPSRRAAGPDETELDNTYTLQEIPDEPAAGFMRQFAETMQKKFGTEFRFVKTGASVVFVEDEAAFKEPEDHVVDISAGRIEIRGGSPQALLRALQWLELQMDQNGAPVLKTGRYARETRFGLRMIYTFMEVQADFLLDPDKTPYPDAYLERLSKMGINAVWLQGVLYTLVPDPFAPQLSDGWEKRSATLRDLCLRAAKYGIDVILYINEPRAMYKSFFEAHPELKGASESDFSALCTSAPGVLDYLRGNLRRLFTDVPELGGIFAITMSENLTHCYSRVPGDTPCPRCSKRTVVDIMTEVHDAIFKTVHEIKPTAKLICWTWAWREGTEAELIRRMPPYVQIMCTSEESIPTNIGGIPNKVIDYSISIPGPGEKAKSIWKLAADNGTKYLAKVQFNNTWECCTVPFIPVFGLIREHITGLTRAGANGLMLSWTLGGCPSKILEYASQFYWTTPDAAASEHEFYAPEVMKATDVLCEAFREFPFAVQVLYMAPQNYGPMNLLYEKKTGLNATMIGCPFDNLRGWRANYPEEIFIDQWRKLCEGWKRGLEALEALPEGVCDAELLNMARAVYYFFHSTYQQCRFVYMRDRLAEDPSYAAQIREIADIEAATAVLMAQAMSGDSRIGYEPSNNYLFVRNDLWEKVINCEYIKTCVTFG